MFVTYIHRKKGSRNTKNTYDFLVQVRNFLLPLSLKVLRHRERDAHSFYSGFSICPHQHVWHPPQGHWPGFGKQAKVDPSRSVSSSQLSLTFSKSSKSFAHFRCVTSPAISSSVSHLGHFDISEWHIRSARAREHLSNLCVEPKESRPY